MKREVEINNWNRKEVFNFFKAYTDPICGVTVNLDFTEVYREAKRDGVSFYLYYLHLLMRAVNAYDPMRLHIEDDKLFLYDRVGIEPTVGRPDGTIGFAYLPYYDDRAQFIAESEGIIARVKAASGLCFDQLEGVDDPAAIYFTAIPWLQFTDLKHPLRLTPGDCNPRISTGKLFEQQGRLLMPFSIQVHHALMDGYHMAEYIRLVETLVAEAGLSK